MDGGVSEIPEDVFRTARKYAEEICSEQLAAGWDGHIDVETEIVARAIMAERERCARLVEDEDGEYSWAGEHRNIRLLQEHSRELAAAIRAQEPK